MRAAFVFVVGVGAAIACVASCTLTSNLDDLQSGAKDTGTSIPETCDPTAVCAATTLTVKMSDIAGCGQPEVTDPLKCRKSIYDICSKKDPCCPGGGFGPVAFPDSASAVIICTPAPLRSLDWTTITSKSTTCTATTPATNDACTVALQKYESAIDCEDSLFQFFDGSGKAQFLCFSSADNASATINPITVGWPDLTAKQPSCTQTSVDKQACTTAIHQLCRDPTQGPFVSGFGPVAIDPVTTPPLTIACVN